MTGPPAHASFACAWVLTLAPNVRRPTQACAQNNRCHPERAGSQRALLRPLRQARMPARCRRYEKRDWSGAMPR
jgi:hypothetical protein